MAEVSKFDWRTLVLAPVLVILLAGTCLAGFGMYTRLSLIESKLDMYIRNQDRRVESLESRVEKLEDKVEDLRSTP